MKLSSKFLCVALLALFTVTASAQSSQSAVATTTVADTATPTAPTGPTSETVPGALSVTEGADGWLFTFTDMGDTRALVFVVAMDTAPSHLSLGQLGELPMEVRGIFFIALAGTTSKDGEILVSLDRPKTPDPDLEGLQLGVQGVSVDYRHSLTLADLKTSNAEKFTFTAINGR